MRNSADDIKNLYSSMNVGELIYRIDKDLGSKRGLCSGGSGSSTENEMNLISSICYSLMMHGYCSSAELTDLMSNKPRMPDVTINGDTTIECKRIPNDCCIKSKVKELIDRSEGKANVLLFQHCGFENILKYCDGLNSFNDIACYSINIKSQNEAEIEFSACVSSLSAGKHEEFIVKFYRVPTEIHIGSAGTVDSTDCCKVLEISRLINCEKLVFMATADDSDNKLKNLAEKYKSVINGIYYLNGDTAYCYGTLGFLTAVLLEFGKCTIYGNIPELEASTLHSFSIKKNM